MGKRQLIKLNIIFAVGKGECMKNKSYQKTISGFTLIEVLLVLVIGSMLIFMGLSYVQNRTLAQKQDRTAMQMQQIMNAGLAYYVANGSWPTMAQLTASSAYLPAGGVLSPWNGVTYSVAQSANRFVWYVWIPVVAAAGSTTGSAMASANVIAGQLPVAYTSRTNGSPPTTGAACNASSTTCYVVASINLPGQNLNNASALNFAGVYSHGGCVPVPTCPPGPTGSTMTPQVYVIPISISGVNDAASSTNIYPISSFTAYATGGTNNSPPACTTGLPTTPPCGQIVGGAPSSNRYWRACVQIVTTKGDVRVTRADRWGNLVKLGAFTRCSIANEPSGSHYLNVFSH